MGLPREVRKARKNSGAYTFEPSLAAAPWEPAWQLLERCSWDVKQPAKSLAVLKRRGNWQNSGSEPEPVWD